MKVSLIYLSAICMAAVADRLDQSFEPPFNEFDYSGEKLVNINWKNFGSSVVNTNFVRLTPDRQSKKGALWSRSVNSISALTVIYFLLQIIISR